MTVDLDLNEIYNLYQNDYFPIIKISYTI